MTTLLYPAAVVGGLLLVGAMAACHHQAPPAATVASATSAVAPPTTTASAAPSSTGPRTIKWVELAVGDCVGSLPAVELGEVTVAVDDCALPHAAEVYLLTPIAVNLALTDVAGRECAAGLSGYVGAAGTSYSVTYLIDSRQDRTANNPLPSTVVCLLTAADGSPLTGSARR